MPGWPPRATPSVSRSSRRSSPRIDSIPSRRTRASKLALAESKPREAREVRGRNAREVDREQLRTPLSGKCLRGPAPPGPRPSAEVEPQTLAAPLDEPPQRLARLARQGNVLQPGRRGRELAERGETLIEPPAAEEDANDLPVDSQRPRQQGRLRPRLILDQPDKPAPGERSVRREAPPACDLLLHRRAQEVEHQLDCGEPRRDVVLQVRVEPLVAQIDLRGQRDDDRVEIDRQQFVAIAELAQPRPRLTRLERGRLAGPALERRLARDSVDQPLEVAFET